MNRISVFNSNNHSLQTQLHNPKYNKQAFNKKCLRKQFCNIETSLNKKQDTSSLLIETI